MTYVSGAVTPLPENELMRNLSSIFGQQRKRAIDCKAQKSAVDPSVATYQSHIMGSV